AGADVVERFDRDDIGKGYALAFGLAHVAPPYDAVVFVDGDCTVNTAFLSAISEKLEEGAEALQAYYAMAPERDSRAAAVHSLALTLVHYVRPLAKERLHASAGLKGSGMCFTRTVIDDIGWSATGLAEDVEQHVRLLRAAHRVAFAPGAVVTGAAPDTLADAGAQHRRWEAGRASAARHHGFRLLLEGLRTRSVARADAGIELLLPPLSVVVAGVLALAALGAIMRWPWLVAASAVSVVSLACYVVSGLWLQRLGARGTAQAVLSMPRYALWKLGLYASAVARPPAAWEPTRSAAEDRTRR
ncbi:MAG TPA: glycosyltransferase family 2 protein, partial [Dehalococcoidia bacterium]|nr:glycosyltransferase family 2 protein [Dehalococcoidia bacterium]